MTDTMTTPAVEHRMLPGTHERPDGPECRCGLPWSWWLDMCLAQHKAAYPERYAGQTTTEGARHGTDAS